MTESRYRSPPHSYVHLVIQIFSRVIFALCVSVPIFGITAVVRPCRAPEDNALGLVNQVYLRRTHNAFSQLVWRRKVSQSVACPADEGM